jgi:hypothetical protein
MATTLLITLPNDAPHKVDVISRFNDAPDGTAGSEIERIIVDPGESFPLIVNAAALTIGVQIVIQERQD